MKIWYEAAKEIERKAGLMLLCTYTQGGNTTWDRRAEFQRALASLVDEFWDEFKRTAEEERDLQDAVNSW